MQGDIAGLNAEDIDWESRVLTYRSQKTNSAALLHFGDEVAGPFFPYQGEV